MMILQREMNRLVQLRNLLSSLLLITVTCGFCSPSDGIDLRQVHPEVFQKLTILDQGDYGVCYSFAGSALIDYFRILSHSDQSATLRTNPVYAAQRTAMAVQAEDAEGGNICDVVNTISSEGTACANYGITGHQISGFGDLAQTQLINEVYMPYLTGTTFHAVNPNDYTYPRRTHLTAAQKTYLNKFDDYLTWLKITLSSRGISYYNIPSDKEIFSFIQNIYVRGDFSTFTVTFENWLTSANCRTSSFRVPALSCKSYSRATLPASPMSTLDQTLQTEKRPVGIDLCSNVLTNKRYKGYTNGNVASDCGAHAVLVIE